MLGNARAYRLEPVKKHAKCVAATDKNDKKTVNLKHEPNYIHTNMYNYIQ